jgi:hypothetical protein
MSYLLIINDIVIPETDILDANISTKEQVNAEFALEASTLEITLNNINPVLYDPDVSKSLFYSDWYNASVVYKDNTTDLILFRGKIKSREKQKTKSKNTVKIKADNILKDILKIKCTSSYGIVESLTPAEIIYRLLTIDCKVPADQINDLSFATAKGIQGNNCIRINYTPEKTAGMGEVLNKIMAMSCCYLYQVSNVFHLYQWQPYNANTRGILIKANDIVTGTYKRTTDDKVIYNEYSLLYQINQNTTGQLLSSASDLTSTELRYLENSKKLFGSIIFKNHEDVNLSEEPKPENYSIIYVSRESAQFYGRFILQRFYEVRELIEFAVTFETANRNELNLLTQIDLTDENYSREPIRIYGREIKKKNNQIVLSGQFIDIPHLPSDPYLRYKKPPEAPKILDVTGRGMETGDLEVTISFSIPSENTKLTYLLYLSKNGYQWHDTKYKTFVSPIQIIPTQDKGINYITLADFEESFWYFLKITAVDEFMNESSFSKTTALYSFNRGEFAKWLRDLLKSLFGD